MKLLDQSCHTPEENLALDEYLLHRVEGGQDASGICRIWESRTHFVVLGLSKTVDSDVHREACQHDNVPILKRCSGGGTVLQGPGCFNYGVILPMSHHTDLAAIHSTTLHMLSMIQKILRPLIPSARMDGISDLTVNGIKFSGNAQRRLRRTMLFHGTILYQFNIPLVSRYLKEPPMQPAYRDHRTHDNFIHNVSVSYHALKSAFQHATSGAMSPSITVPSDMLARYASY